MKNFKLREKENNTKREDTNKGEAIKGFSTDGSSYMLHEIVERNATLEKTQVHMSEQSQDDEKSAEHGIL